MYVVSFRVGRLLALQSTHGDVYPPNRGSILRSGSASSLGRRRTTQLQVPVRDSWGDPRMRMRGHKGAAVSPVSLVMPAARVRIEPIEPPGWSRHAGLHGFNSITVFLLRLFPFGKAARRVGAPFDARLAFIVRSAWTCLYSAVVRSQVGRISRRRNHRGCNCRHLRRRTSPQRRGWHQNLSKLLIKVSPLQLQTKPNI